MTKTTFYHLHSTGMNPCTLVKEQYELARDSWLCPGCAAPKPGTGAIDVWIQEKRPAESPLSFVSGCGLGLVHQELLGGLGAENVNTCLHLGKLHDSSGNEIEGWYTFRGHFRLIVRGISNAGIRRCSDCERILYFAMRKRYIYPTPPRDIPIFESHLFGLIFGRELLDALPLGNWPKLGVEKLEVLSKPKDGLPEIFL